MGVAVVREHTAKYRNGKDHVVEVATGCRDADSDAQIVRFDPEAVRRGERDVSDSRGLLSQSCQQWTNLPADPLVFDVHALRTTFGTLLSKAGVAPRMAQAAMRHSDINLTMGVYTDPRLLDVVGAVELLPTLSLTGEELQNHAVARATGTDDRLPSEGVRKFAPMLAPKTDKPATPGSFPVKMAGCDDVQERFSPDAGNAGKHNEKGRLLGKSKRPSKSGRQDGY